MFGWIDWIRCWRERRLAREKHAAWEAWRDSIIWEGARGRQTDVKERSEDGPLDGR